MRNILITGGTGKIGGVLVKAMLNDGFNVAFTTRNFQNGQKFIKDNELNKEKTCVIEVDFQDENAIDKISKQLKFSIDGVIHNARSLNNLEIDNNEGLVSSQQFQNEMFIDVTFPYLLTYDLLHKHHPLKDVVFIGSIYGVVAHNTNLFEKANFHPPINYGVAKAAQIHLTKELAVRLAKENIRVNAVSYGGVEGRADEKFKKRYKNLTPLRGMLKEEDLYPPIQFLLKNESNSITGENIKIDGGWTIW